VARLKTYKSGSCRFCGSRLRITFVDLGMSPICNDNLQPEDVRKMEPFYPLRAYVCEECFLVQIEEYVAPEELFKDYDYFSSYSDTWLEHARAYTDAMIERFGFNHTSRVIELGSNDGYLLQYFLARHIPVLGVEPAANVAERALKKGITTIIEFFGQRTATEIREEYGEADLIVGNNVLAHTPDLNDFVGGMKLLLRPEGVITLEFPHLMRLVEGNQFDTIYHEHFSYLSFLTVERIFAAHGLTLFDVEELGTHGGSLRIYAAHTECDRHAVTARVGKLKERELAWGVENLETYTSFAERVCKTKRKLLKTLIEIKDQGKSIAGYGAPGKGNTLLNYCGIRTDFLDYTVDRNPRKQGKFLPGSLIPVYHPDKIRETRPDYILILPWNLRDEIVQQLDYIRDWGGRFIIPIPEPRIVD